MPSRWSERRAKFRAIIIGNRCVYPGSVFDPMSARAAEAVGFEVAMLAGSVASMAILGAPDNISISLSEFAALGLRICRATNIPLMVDADHGYGNALNVMRTVEELLKLDPTRYDIVVFGAEPHPNYDRIMLSSVLAGEKQIEEIVINPRSWYDEHGIVLHAGDPAAKIDTKARTVASEKGVTVQYDRLLLATGSKPIVPPIPT